MTDKSAMQKAGYTPKQELDYLLTRSSSGGSPGGSTTEIQYNLLGVLAGDSGLTWDVAAGVFTAAGTGGTSIVVNDAGGTVVLNSGGNNASVTVDNAIPSITLNTGHANLTIDESSRILDINSGQIAADNTNARVVVATSKFVVNKGLLYYQSANDNYWQGNLSDTGVLTWNDTLSTSLP